MTRNLHFNWSNSIGPCNPVMIRKTITTQHEFILICIDCRRLKTEKLVYFRLLYDRHYVRICWTFAGRHMYLRLRLYFLARQDAFFKDTINTRKYESFSVIRPYHEFTARVCIDVVVGVYRKNTTAVCFRANQLLDTCRNRPYSHRTRSMSNKYVNFENKTFIRHNSLYINFIPFEILSDRSNARTPPSFPLIETFLKVIGSQAL